MQTYKNISQYLGIKNSMWVDPGELSRWQLNLSGLFAK